jgi:hypothetical protein
MPNSTPCCRPAVPPPPVCGAPLGNGLGEDGGCVPVVVADGCTVAVCVTVGVGLVVGVGLAVGDLVGVADGVLVTDARVVGEAVADAVAVADARPVVAEAGADTAGEVLTVLLARGVDEGVLACGVGMDGKLEPGPLGVQAETATATSSAPANALRRTFMKPPPRPADNHNAYYRGSAFRRRKERADGHIDGHT